MRGTFCLLSAALCLVTALVYEQQFIALPKYGTKEMLSRRLNCGVVHKS
jgi:hypothetical protein